MGQVEKFEGHLSRIELELALGVWARSKGIRMILSDIDDTLYFTQIKFTEQLRIAVARLVQGMGGEAEVWEQRLEKENNRLFVTHGVNPNRWTAVIDNLAERYGIRPEVGEEAKGALAEIYTRPLEMKPGVRQGLDFVRKTGAMMVVAVTHANQEWTWRKYENWGLSEYLQWKDIYIVNEDGHKGVKEWLAAMKYFRIAPKECLVIGDSPRSDILPALEAGAGAVAHVEGTTWSVHQLAMPPEVRQWKSFGDVCELGREVIRRRDGGGTGR